MILHGGYCRSLLVVKAFLFGKNHQVFEDEIPAVQALEVATQTPANAFEFMLETLKEAKHQPVNEDHFDHWQTVVDCAWVPLDKYYQRLDDCSVCYAAVTLHPAFRWRHFEMKWVDYPDWITSAKSKVKKDL